MFDDDEVLAFDLGYAVWRALRKRVPIDDCRRMAAALARKHHTAMRSLGSDDHQNLILPHPRL